MGFFGKKKEDVDIAQTQEIKQATAADLKPINQEIQASNLFSQPQEKPTPVEQPQNNNFSNPFSQPQEPLPSQQINQSPNYQNIQQTQEPNLSTQIPKPQIQPLQNNIGLQQNSIQQPTIENPSGQETQQVTNQQDLNQIAKSLQQDTTKLPTKEEIHEMIDETVEKIIEERWEKLLSSVQKVVSWKESQEKQLNDLQENLKDFKENFEKLDTKLTNKISSYDRDILDVNSEIKALEKVFQKITPTLVNNVNELAKIADELRGVKTESNSSKNTQE